MKILFTGGCPDWVTKEVTSLGHEVISVAADAYVNETKFCEGIKGIDVYVSGGLETCTAKVIESGDTLKAIIFLGVDYKAYIDAKCGSKKKYTHYKYPRRKRAGGCRTGLYANADWRAQNGTDVI